MQGHTEGAALAWVQENTASVEHIPDESVQTSSKATTVAACSSNECHIVKLTVVCHCDHVQWVLNQVGHVASPLGLSLSPMYQFSQSQPAICLQYNPAFTKHPFWFSCHFFFLNWPEQRSWETFTWIRMPWAEHVIIASTWSERWAGYLACLTTGQSVWSGRGKDS